ncbi:MAG: aminotransferase class I/II-fold pyridoxal phosphate-dependent enzyme [Betaproteobacteria bacterium]|nr:aminotransferase class I/II-fold pyridoxal phosphate-dependent enzyme [Betaproteobacteria bacterium]
MKSINAWCLRAPPNHWSHWVRTLSVISVNSFSKTFSMTGWRLGWLVLPPQMSGAVERLAQNLYISASSLAQRAALAAFEPESCRGRRLP